jgi:hypothetical protein
MKPSQTGPSTLEIEGVVCRVDTINRELVIRTGTALMTFEAPCRCTIELHRESVKLRMVQPRDRVKIIYTDGRGSLVARSIEVQSGPPG